MSKHDIVLENLALRQQLAVPPKNSIRIDPLLASNELALDCQQFGSQYRSGTKDSPQKSQTISKRLTSTNKKVAEVCQKVLCGIHAAKIIQLVARSKFT